MIVAWARKADRMAACKAVVHSPFMCMLDFREKYMKGALGIAVTSANICPH